MHSELWTMQFFEFCTMHSKLSTFLACPLWLINFQLGSKSDMRKKPYPTIANSCRIYA